MKRWIVYLLVLIGLHLCLIFVQRESMKEHFFPKKDRTHYFSPNWNSPGADDIFMVKDTLGIIRYYKIIEGLKEGNLTLKSGKYNFSAGLKESISGDKWNFDFMNNEALYADSIQQFSLEAFLALKEHVYLTRGFGKATVSSKNPFFLEYYHFMIILRSLGAFILIWFFGFLNAYLSALTKFSKEILLGIFIFLLSFPEWWYPGAFYQYPLMKILHMSRIFFYAFILLYAIRWLDRKAGNKGTFADQQAIKFITILLGGGILSYCGGYLYYLVSDFLEIHIYSNVNFDKGGNWRFYISPYIGSFWLSIATGNFLNNFRNHFFQLRRKAKAFKYAQKQELEFKSELETLQAKINPHFLYNSLNSIASLAQSDPEKTETMALALSKFYKEKTNRKENLWSTVAEEMDMLKTYLAIEQIRFGDRLKVELYSSENANEEKLPRFLLQPLIENAIKYGYNSTDNKITVKVFIEYSNRILSIRILDSGPKFSDQLNTGYGIRSVQKKLKLFYSGNHKMEFINTPEKQIFIQIKY